MKKISPDFLIEFFKSCTASSQTLETGIQFLAYEYLPSKEYKEFWKILQDYYKSHSRAPSIGILSQLISDKQNLLSILTDVKNASIVVQEDLFEQLENYIKNSKFRVAYDTLYETFSKGDKEQAYKEMEKMASDINNFSIRSKMFDSIFGQINERMSIRRAATEDPSSLEINHKVPFGIGELDYISHGGMSEGDTACFLAQSGVGKSRALRHFGIHAARCGYNVAHFQFEGTKQECLDFYDAGWTGISVERLSKGIVSDEEEGKINKILGNIKQYAGEIFVVAFEQFSSGSMLDVDNSITELEKVHGKKIHLVLIDYLEKVEPGDGKKYSVDQEKQKREVTSQKMKNVAVKHKTRVITATQAHGIEKKLLNSPEFVMDRYNTSMGKNLIDPFSFFISMNQTVDEKKAGIMRLFSDKIRNYPSQQIMFICQDYGKQKFFDKAKTELKFFAPK